MQCKFTAIFVIGLIIGTTTSCKKAEDSPPALPKTAYKTSYLVDGFSTNDGVLAAINEAQYERGEFQEEISKGKSCFAYFYSQDGIGPFVDAGFIRINNIVPVLFDEDTGVYYPADSSGKKINYAFGDTINWNVSGSTETEVHPFTATIDSSPSQPVIDTNVFEIKRSESFTLKMLSTLSKINAREDGSQVKTVFVIRQGEKVIAHELTAVATQFQFSVNELKLFSAGDASIEIGAYRYLSKVVDDKTFHIVLGSRTTRDVIIK